MIFLLWIIFTLLTGLVAYQKNRNVAVWLIAGIIFGFFALLVVLLLPRLEHCEWQD